MGDGRERGWYHQPMERPSLRRKLLKRLPWRRPVPPALVGTLALLRLLPRVHLPRTIILAVVVLLNMLLPIGLTVVTWPVDRLASQAAVEGGLDSPGWPGTR